MLPSWDEGAGEVWARPKSEDVRGHCERCRPGGGGRGALPGALLWLEHQVRQDPGTFTKAILELILDCLTDV